MQGFMVLAGLEAVLIVSLTMKLRELRRLQKELHQTVFDLALACTLASKGRYEEAHAAARRWHDRMRAFKRARGTGRRLRRRNPVCGLINASPRSPREEEIEAILARIEMPSDPLGQVSPALAAAFSEWEIVREHYEAAGNK